MFGLLNIHKSSGPTSRDVVNRVQRLVRPAKAGHAGTLDPLASGVLVVCVGPATRLVEYVQRQSKRYTAAFLLGRTSDTLDVDGQVQVLDDPPVPSRDEVEAALPPLIGHIQQRPPDFSAVKVGGKRAYALARRQQPVDLAARGVDVYEMRVVEYDYPRLVLDIHCGSGTYVRSIGRDLGQSLGTAAVMSALIRTQIGLYSLDDAVALDELSADNLAKHLQNAAGAVTALPRVVLSPDEVVEISHGRSIAAGEERIFHAEVPANVKILDHADAKSEIAALDTAGSLVAILIPRGASRLGPSRFFAST